MEIVHPPEIEKTHVPVSQYSLGPYWFLSAMPKGVFVADVKSFEWWASYSGYWVSRESFPTLEDAMIAAAEFAKENRCGQKE
jgi:hypothetical protein